jgi:hypothetical protein
VDWLLTEMSASWMFWAVSCTLAALGTVLALHCAWRGLAATESAHGTVRELQETTDSDGATLYRAVVLFVVRGAEQRVADPLACRPAAYRIGEQVRVYYPPGRPDRAQLGRWRYVWPWLWVASGGWVCLAAMLWWRFA